MTEETMRTYVAELVGIPYLAKASPEESQMVLDVGVAVRFWQTNQIQGKIHLSSLASDDAKKSPRGTGRSSSTHCARHPILSHGKSVNHTAGFISPGNCRN